MKKHNYILLLVAILGIQLISISQYVSAEKKDPYEGYDHRILLWDENTWTFTADESVYIAYGWYISQEEFDMGMRTPPKIEYYIDGVEVEGKHFSNKIHDVPEYHSPVFWYYVVFEALHFEPGEHYFYSIFYTPKMVYFEFGHPFYVLEANIPL